MASDRNGSALVPPPGYEPVWVNIGEMLEFKQRLPSDCFIALVRLMEQSSQLGFLPPALRDLAGIARMPRAKFTKIVWPIIAVHFRNTDRGLICLTVERWQQEHDALEAHLVSEGDQP